MKNFLILTLSLVTFSAMAEGTNTGTAGPRGVTSTAAQQQQQQTTATSQSAASNQGNSQNITFSAPSTTNNNVTTSSVGSMTINGETTQRSLLLGGTDSSMKYEYGDQTQTIRNTPSVSGPPLVSSNDTCMGSASGSANVPGFGISLGKTYTDNNCVMLKNSRELWNMGMKAAAMALMCTDASNKEALELTGFVCPTKKNTQAAQ